MLNPSFPSFFTRFCFASVAPACLLFFSACSENNGGNQRSEFVGRDACQPCHEEEHRLFTGSDHDLAMDRATDESVLGDFDNAGFTHLGVESRFYRRNGRFFVETEGPGGEMGEFEIKYTFGFYPLQQYLVEFEGGKIQCLPLCWDSRPGELGGQRWFHVYGAERITHDDPLYWTRTSQRWNYMCAECHSTRLKKNFDPDDGTYRTSWSEIDVSCEACHGPGSRHIEWAETLAEGGRDRPEAGGLEVRLKETGGGRWEFNDTSNSAVRVPARQSGLQVELCARCHSRRSIISEDYRHGNPLLDTHFPSLLREDLYFHDGQMRDEVYVYGSFLQSRMHEKGVVCSDCHDPHTNKTIIGGDALCFRCHKAEVFGTPAHHFHPVESKGARCVECHMPERTYMVVDPRRDHGFRVPRPDLAEKLGSTNICADCHSDQSPEWAGDRFNEWYKPSGERDFGGIFKAAREGAPGAGNQLIGLVNDPETSSIVRATALSLLVEYPGMTMPVIQKEVGNRDPLTRAAAVNLSATISPQERVPLLVPLLRDSVRLVRILAARSLTEVPLSAFSKSEQDLLSASLVDYESSQRLNADHPTGLMNLGNLYLLKGDPDSAAVMFRKAFELEPVFIPAYVNLADILREKGNEKEAEKILRAALVISPHAASVHNSLGLMLIRTGNPDEAIVHLGLAVEYEGGNPRYGYVYGVALNSVGRSDEAVEVLENALHENAYDESILYALATIERDRGNAGRALVHVAVLRDLFPDNRNILEFERTLKARLRDGS